VFTQITSFENLYSAYLGARKCKRYRTSILRFSRNLEENLISLQRELLARTYKHGGYREFIISDSKKRLIKAPLFRDRVIHHAVCNVVELIFERRFIYDSYACRKGKGTHAAVKRLESFVKSLAPAKTYCLKCDISKYFNSIDHEILLGLLKNKIKNEDVLWLLYEIISSNSQGIPIGNLTSQLFANIYLNELDHFIKRILRERYYIRYMDDFLILSNKKENLRYDKERIKIFLVERLKLRLHPKKAEIFPIDKGIDFLGYVVRDSCRFLRKPTVKRFLKKKQQYEKMIKNSKWTEQSFRGFCDSWRGYANFANSYKLLEKLGLN